MPPVARRCLPWSAFGEWKMMDSVRHLPTRSYEAPRTKKRHRKIYGIDTPSEAETSSSLAKQKKIKKKQFGPNSNY